MVREGQPMRRASKVRLAAGFACYLLSAGAAVWLMAVVAEPRWVRFALAVTALVTTIVFMVAFHLSTEGGWRRTDIGVHLMVFAAGNALILLYASLAFFGVIPTDWLPYLSGLTYLTVAWLFGWRTSIMDSYQSRGEGRQVTDPDPPNPDDDDQDDYVNGYPPKA